MEAIRIYLGVIVVFGALLSFGSAAQSKAPPANQIQQGEMRATIDNGKLAVDAPTYKAYQECLGKIKLAQRITEVIVARNACQKSAKTDGFTARLPATASPDDELTSDNRKNWQTQILEREK